MEPPRLHAPPYHQPHHHVKVHHDSKVGTESLSNATKLNATSKETANTNLHETNNEVGVLPNLASFLLPLVNDSLSEIKLLYVTTESGDAGAAILEVVQALYPRIRVVSTVDDLTQISFTHTGSKKQPSRANRLKPVRSSITWTSAFSNP